MNTNIKKDYEEEVKNIEERQKMLAVIKEKILPLSELLSEEVTPNFAYKSIWLTMSKREDLQILMTLAQVWKKSTNGSCLHYTAIVDKFEVSLRAQDSALPATCRIEEKDIKVPAMPAHTYKEKVLVCDL